MEAMADRGLLGVLVELLVNKQQSKNTKHSNEPLSIVLLISLLSFEKCLPQPYSAKQRKTTTNNGKQ